MKKWRYKEVSVGSIKRKNGMMLEHRYKAEVMLGRSLKDGETVHHIDSDRCNNTTENLMVFKSVADHARFHRGYTAVKDEDVYYCDKNQFKHPCKVCGKLTKWKTYCSKKCVGLDSRITERPSKEELIRLLSSNSWLAVGRMFGVSDNTIRRWARSYGILK